MLASKQVLTHFPILCKPALSSSNKLTLEFLPKKNPKLQAQWEYCEREANQIPICVMIGAGELEQNVVKVKDMHVKEGEAKAGVTVPRTEMIDYLKKTFSLAK